MRTWHVIGLAGLGYAATGVLHGDPASAWLVLAVGVAALAWVGAQAVRAAR